MSLRSFRSLCVALGVAVSPVIAVAGCSGPDFSAGSSAAGNTSAAGSSAGDAANGGDSANGGDAAGSANASAGHAGLGQSGDGTGGATQSGGAAGLGEAGASETGGASAGGKGSAGSAGKGGAGGASAGSGGTLGSSGSIGTGEAGDIGAAGSCDAVAWFPDGDGDGYGRSSGQVISCTPPTNGAWVRLGGDCDDDNKAVSPKETDYESSSYTLASSATSFDYDCSGVEEPDPTQLGAAPACSSILSCTGSGFAPTTRSGPGVNPLCGSTSKVTCTQVSLSCTAVVTQVSDGYRCH
jgi:hypothetical protein